MQLSGEEHFHNIWEKAQIMSAKVKTWVADSAVEFKDARAPRRRKPSARLQALVGELATPQQELPVELHYRVNIYYVSLVSEMRTRFQGKDQDILCALGDICLKDIPETTSFEKVAEFYELNEELLVADHRLFTTFKKGHPDVEGKSAAEVVELLHEYELVDILPEFSKAAIILAVIPATSCSAERSFSGLRRMKTYLRNSMGQKRLSNIALLNIERSYANKVLQESMDRVIDIFGRRRNRDSYFF